MDRGPLSVRAHSLVEPLIGLLFLLAPAFLDVEDDAARTLFIVVGVAILLVGSTTRWRMSLLKLIPLRVHALLDLGLGALLVAAPFLFGFSDETAPTVFSIALGAGEIGAALLTRWDPRDEVGGTGEPQARFR
jgi:prepilin signal peptidase PulO-like enzyme (type II secretory pathway)